MRDDAKEQLKMVDEKIKKAKASLEEMEEKTIPKTVSAEFADLLPLGQFPDHTSPPQDDDHKPHRS
ncbi:MAG TPA: hypothetical protein VNT57_04445 [Desulfobacteria bacterium]|nr:hypothetical protein [Desulfobacteria bacterium]